MGRTPPAFLSAVSHCDFVSLFFVGTRCVAVSGPRRAAGVVPDAVLRGVVSCPQTGRWAMRASQRFICRHAPENFGETGLLGNLCGAFVTRMRLSGSWERQSLPGGACFLRGASPSLLWHFLPTRDRWRPERYTEAVPRTRSWVRPSASSRVLQRRWIRRESP